MAAVAQMYTSNHDAFLSHASQATTSILQQEDQEAFDDQFTTLFCRALYDYEAQDTSALSFRRNDIIEVLTQQPSGWWDGLLGDERGWFPSNYVTVISDEEAELAFSGSEFPNMDGLKSADELDPSDMSHAMMGGSQVENEEWLDNEISLRNSLPGPANAIANGTSQSSDFWVPQVTQDGQIYYVNTQTGQHSRDLPQEAEDETSDGDLAGLTSQSSSRSGTSAGLGFGPNGTSETSRINDDIAGFGLPRRTGTPEPWVRKLADDGMSYYYFNKLDGKVQWTRPETRNLHIKTNNQATAHSSPALQQQPNSTARLSVYSDDSDVQSQEDLKPARTQQLNGHQHQAQEKLTRDYPDENLVLKLTSAERIAHSLQTTLAPPPPELVTDLSTIAQDRIQAVVENLQGNGLVRRSEDDERMDELISGVVLAVRNLLYITSAPSGQIPGNLFPHDVQDPKSGSFQPSPLKPAQRKVTATLSRLVLSARAMQYDSGSSISDTLNRIEVDAEELERAVISFVLEVQQIHHSPSPNGSEVKPLKRLYGALNPKNIGVGLVGAGAAGSWMGFGWVSLDDRDHTPVKILGSDVITELDSHLSRLEAAFTSFKPPTKTWDISSIDQTRLRGQNLVTQLSSFLACVANVNIARHVDIDGIRQGEISATDSAYLQTIDKARVLVRNLETAMQSLYDDTAALLHLIQLLQDSDVDQVQQNEKCDSLGILPTSMKSNLSVVQQMLKALLSVGYDQAGLAQDEHDGSIQWRMSRLSAIDNQSSGSIDKPLTATEDSSGTEQTPVKQDIKGTGHEKPLSLKEEASSSRPDLSISDDDQISSNDGTAEGEDSRNPDLDDEEGIGMAISPSRGTGKLRKILGNEFTGTIINTQLPLKPVPDFQPWYLRPNYNQTEILIDTDGTVRGGTVRALVERLTAHEQGDSTFIKTFLMTFKSFTTLDELLDLLIERFKIQPPANLTPSEREEWGKLKQHVIQMRVINTLKSMVVDDDVLEKEDMFILDRMKEFISTEEVSRFAAAKQLMMLIERAQRGDPVPKMMVNQGPPPPPILPKTSKKLKLLDIEPLELARQLTIMESGLYQKIRPMECLQRAREQRTENLDNIARVIQTSNRIADWVAESVLSKEDSRKRAAAVKHLISVADRCRILNNFSSMIAITSGLNTPPIRRLKRTWEQVNQRFMAQFGACEMTIDSNKNFTKYRQLMASVTPPCVPFIGIFLSTLQFIQDGNPDNLPGDLVNFRKRQKASEVINDIKRWQAQPFNFQNVSSIQAYIEDSLNHFIDTRASSEHFWTLSLEREPREREDEKMARLLQESGFL